MGSPNEFLWTEEGFEEKTYADGAVLRDGQKNSAGKPLAVLESQTGRMVFFPSEARSLAAALTAWADRVEPVAAKAEPTEGEKHFKATDDDGDAVEAWVAECYPGKFLVRVSGESRCESALLTAEQATSLAAFLTRSEPIKLAGTPFTEAPSHAVNLSKPPAVSGLRDEFGLSARIDALELTMRCVGSLPDLARRVDVLEEGADVGRLAALESQFDIDPETGLVAIKGVGDVEARLASLEAARDALKDVLTVQARHDESILDLSARLNSVGAFPGRTGPTSPVPNPLLEAAIANARFMDECATDDYGSDRCKATEDGVRCLLGGGTCAGDHVFPEGAEIRAGLRAALEGEEEPSDDETISDRVKALEDYYAGLPMLEDKVSDLERGSSLKERTLTTLGDRLADVERWVGGVADADVSGRIAARLSEAVSTPARSIDECPVRGCGAWVPACGDTLIDGSEKVCSGHAMHRLVVHVIGGVARLEPDRAKNGKVLRYAR